MLKHLSLRTVFEIALSATILVPLCGCGTKTVARHTQPSAKGFGFASDSTSPEYKAEALEKSMLHKEALDLLRAGNVVEATERLESLLIKYPNDIIVLNELAPIYHRIGHDKKAFEAYRRLVHIPENTVSSTQTDPRVLARYGEYCMKRGDRREAELAYRIALENTKPGLGPAEPPFKFKIANFNDLRAQALMAAGMTAYFRAPRQHDVVVEFGREALRVKPNWDIGRYYLARYYLDVPPVDAASARREFAALRDSGNREIRKRSRLMWEVLGLPTEKERIRQWEAEHGRKFPGQSSGSN